MINLIKMIFSSLKSIKENDKNFQNNEVIKFKKILYISIIACAIGFSVFFIIFVIKIFPELHSSFLDSYENSKNIIDNLK